MKRTIKSFNSTLRHTSSKQAKLETKRSKIKKERIAYLTEKYGFNICEYCGKVGIIGGDSLLTLDMHEIDGNHQNCSPDNEYICHRKCHTEITNRNIVVNQEDFTLRELFY